jgi:hypothetical protein
MQDWLLILAPVAAITYFLAHPSEFIAFMGWFGRLIH